MGEEGQERQPLLLVVRCLKDGHSYYWEHHDDIHGAVMRCNILAFDKGVAADLLKRQVIIFKDTGRKFIMLRLVARLHPDWGWTSYYHLGLTKYKPPRLWIRKAQKQDEEAQDGQSQVQRQTDNTG